MNSGILLEDYLDVVDMRVDGIPEPDDWVEDARRRRAMSSWDRVG